MWKYACVVLQRKIQKSSSKSFSIQGSILKTLYGILGVGSEATEEQIEKAYASFLSKLQSGAADLPAEEVNNQMIAIREAHTTLTNPILRQRYDQKLTAASFGDAQVQYSDNAYAAANESVFGTKTILLIGLIVLAGLFIYNNNAKERERLRIEHEHEVQMKAVQIAEDRQKQEAKVQDFVLDKAGDYAENQQAQMKQQQLRLQQQQFERESAQSQQQDLQRQRLEAQQQQQRQQQEQNRLRQEQQQHQQQLQNDKRYLQQLERDHYGKVITY